MRPCALAFNKLKNKKVTYILLPLALLIWGMIIYKIFVSGNAEENYASLPQVGNVKEAPQIKLDTFSLQLNYQDPFLKNAGRVAAYNQNDNQSVKKPEPVKPASKPEEKPLVFPTLRYEGIVKHISKGKALIILNINGKSRFIQTGETVDDIKLVQVHNNDSIIVSYEKQNKTIRKK